MSRLKSFIPRSPILDQSSDKISISINEDKESTHAASAVQDRSADSATPSRRRFLQSTAAAVAASVAPLSHAARIQANTQDSASGIEGASPPPSAPATQQVTLTLNGQPYHLQLEARVTLLDALREYAGLTGTKKGCDRGQCGACTVIADGRRINACLSLAVMHDGESITTVEGLANNHIPSPLQQAFIEQDAFQCGFCTPGQLCSATALLKEWQAGDASAVSENVRRRATHMTDEEIRERMSGNICRCGAYPNIVSAIRIVATQKT
jgi:xanthine dehydrogenase YagT iron-sulfur-binding subunit